MNNQNDEPLTARVHALIAQWREDARLERTSRDPGWVGAESKLLHCAADLEAALAAAQGGADAMTDHDCFQSLVSMGSTDDHGRKRARNECWLRCTKCRAQYAKRVVDAALAAALAPKKPSGT